MLSAPSLAALAGCSRFTVERACRDKKIKAEKFGRNWMIEDDEGQRWAEQYRPHARTPKTASGPGAETALTETGTEA